MKRFLRAIEATDLVKYNANSSGRDTGDCVKRSMSLAFDVPYVEMSKKLIAEMKSQRTDAWNTPSVYRKVIKELSGNDFITQTDPITLDEFAEGLGASGTWLVETGKSANARRNHIVCVIDGTVYDSWNSLNQYVKFYCQIPDVTRNFTELDLRDYASFIDDEVKKVSNSLLKKYEWGKYASNMEATMRMASDYKYSCKISVKLILGPTPYYDKNTWYSFDFSIVCTPSTTEEEAKKIIISTCKTRLYDRMYSVNQKEVKKKERFEEVSSNADSESAIPPHKVHFGYDRNRCERFFNTLPAWVQVRVTSLDVQYPGQYNDSYDMYMYGLPEWGQSNEKINIHAYDASGMKYAIDEYKKTGKVLEPWEY